MNCRFNAIISADAIEVVSPAGGVLLAQHHGLKSTLAASVRDLDEIDRHFTWTPFSQHFSREPLALRVPIRITQQLPRNTYLNFHNCLPRRAPRSRSAVGIEMRCDAYMRQRGATGGRLPGLVGLLALATRLFPGRYKPHR